MLALFGAHEVFKHAVMSLLPSAIVSYSNIAVAYSHMVEMLPPESLGITALIDMSRNEWSHNFSARGTRTPRGTANDRFEHCMSAIRTTCPDSACFPLIVPGIVETLL